MKPYKEAKRVGQIKTQKENTGRTIEKATAHRMMSATEGSRKVLWEQRQQQKIEKSSRTAV